MKLADATWAEVERGGFLVLPVGATEQHGPHLPLGTDIRIVEALVAGLERSVPRVWVAPTIGIGASGEHAGFAGTLSAGSRSLADSLLEIGRSADHFDGVYVVNWHGGNAAAIRAAAERLRSEGRRAGVWRPSLGPDEQGPDGDLHAGRTETSLMLEIAPELVDLARAAAGPPVAAGELVPALRADGVKALSANGVIGDPAGASVEEGGRILAALTGDLVAAFLRFESGAGD